MGLPSVSPVTQGAGDLGYRASLHPVGDWLDQRTLVRSAKRLVVSVDCRHEVVV